MWTKLSTVLWINSFEPIHYKRLFVANVLDVQQFELVYKLHSKLT